MGQHSSETLNREEYAVFLRLLKVAREEAGLSQNEAARRLGIPQSQLWAVESGIRRLDVIEFLDFSIVLGFDPNTFMSKVFDEVKPRLDQSIAHRIRKQVSKKRKS